MSMDSKVGSTDTYGKAPFENNIKRSIPPMTPGATMEKDGTGTQAGTAGRMKGNFKAAVDFAQKQTAPRGC